LGRRKLGGGPVLSISIFFDDEIIDTRNRPFLTRDSGTPVRLGSWLRLIAISSIRS
jgi:hypothetical protein